PVAATSAAIIPNRQIDLPKFMRLAPMIEPDSAVGGTGRDGCADGPLPTAPIIMFPVTWGQ
ncbi:MAG TPA: hypothetical protein VGA19_01995, partial [Rhodospirillales bacterium]